MCTNTNTRGRAFYVIGLMNGFIFLLFKAKLVGKFEVDNKTYRFAFRCAQVGSLVMIPTGGILTTVLASGHVTADKRCVQLFPMWFIWTFGVGVIGLLAAMVYLFLHPLYKSLVFEGEEFNVLRGIYLKNAQIGIGSVMITFLLFLGFAATHQLGESGEGDVYYVLAMAVLTWDAFVLSSATRMTTTIWLPSLVSARCCKRSKSSTLALSHRVSKDVVVRQPTDGKDGNGALSAEEEVQ